MVTLLGSHPPSLLLQPAPLGTHGRHKGSTSLLQRQLPQTSGEVIQTVGVYESGQGRIDKWVG